MTIYETPDRSPMTARRRLGRRQTNWAERSGAALMKRSRRDQSRRDRIGRTDAPRDARNRSIPDSRGSRAIDAAAEFKSSQRIDLYGLRQDRDDESRSRGNSSTSSGFKSRREWEFRLGCQIGWIEFTRSAAPNFTSSAIAGRVPLGFGAGNSSWLRMVFVNPRARSERMSGALAEVVQSGVVVD